MNKVKLLVFSDSHGREHRIEKAIELHNAKCDAFIFLGDGIDKANRIFEGYPDIPHICVRGNCDAFASGEADEALIDFGGIRILCAHGHKYDVKSSLLRFEYAAREKEASLALYGHTHVALETRRDGVVLFNPGSIGMGYPKSTYGVIEIVDGNIICGHGVI